MICGAATLPDRVGRALLGLAECCIDAVDLGPAECSCWSPEYDVDQANPDLSVDPVTREKMVPYKADGTPADRCAGLAAARARVQS